MKYIHKLKFGLAAFAVILLLGCESDAGENSGMNPNAVDATADSNPAAAGFNAADSDAEAVALADRVMESMGGRRAWDNTRFLAWTFFGTRSLVWDKKSGNVRIESIETDLKIIMNVNTSEGRAWTDSVEVTHPDSLAELLDLGRQIWVNDSYWLVMPFKLKDSGVKLKHLGDGRIEEGQGKGVIAEVLELTFEEVGYTPQNRYVIYIPKENTQKLILQWDYFSDNESQVRDFTTPWDDYQQYGNILLSGNRGDASLTDIGVYSEIPDEVFTTFDDVNKELWQ